VRFQLSQKKEEGNAYFKTKNKNKNFITRRECNTLFGSTNKFRKNYNTKYLFSFNYLRNMLMLTSLTKISLKFLLSLSRTQVLASIVQMKKKGGLLIV
jgi:hypothetical protein